MTNALKNLYKVTYMYTKITLQTEKLFNDFNVKRTILSVSFSFHLQIVAQEIVSNFTRNNLKNIVDLSYLRGFTDQLLMLDKISKSGQLPELSVRVLNTASRSLRDCSLQSEQFWRNTCKTT